MPLDPIRTTEEIKESYLDYLATTFRLSDPELQDQLVHALHESEKFIKGPILEATPPFRKGASVKDLVKKGLLSNKFHELQSDKFPLDRPLYLHQQQAIEKIISNGRNVVVSTGTGSGKTETFLVPILNHLFEQKQNNQLSPGVRALLLYPMNALANDQIARLRGLLKNVNYITYGRYTGETKQTEGEALELYRKTYYRDPEKNELISRDKMRETPPHILLTNYAMLEYLLLRPSDNVFFDGEYSHKWSFIVVDEAHTFSGAKGIEMAMLLKRLKDRVNKGQDKRLYCIATSATLGSSNKSNFEVSQFAQNLFGEKFEWVEKDEVRQDVIRAAREPLANKGEGLWTVDPDMYVGFQKQVAKKIIDYQSITEISIKSGLPEEIVETAITKAQRQNSVNVFLYEILKGDKYLKRLQKLLQEKPFFLDKISKEIFEEYEHPETLLVSLVDLANKARLSDVDQPLIPARYHLFVRAIEGAYLSLRPIKQLLLERHEALVTGTSSFPVFEIATCRQCGATYIVGEMKPKEGKTYLAQPGKKYFENPDNLEFFYLPSEQGSFEQLPLDEDEEVVIDPEELKQEEYKLCASCGAIERANALFPICDCDNKQWVSVYHVSSKKGIVYSCMSCGSTSPVGLVWRFLTGNDATASVLATALYQEIPPRSPDRSINSDKNGDPWATPAKQIKNKTESDENGNGSRQLLIFSDSRQDAAFFAPYLAQTYKNILQRRIILHILEQKEESVLKNKWNAADFVNAIIRYSGELDYFDGLSRQKRITEAWKLVLHELLAFDRRNSLEGLGLLGYRLAIPSGWSPFEGFLNMGFSREEIESLYQVLLGNFRNKGALLFPDSVDPYDSFFSPRNREYFFSKKKPEKSGNNIIFGWLPTCATGMNGRLDYILRVIEKISREQSNYEMGLKILNSIWTNDLMNENVNNPWSQYFSKIVRKDGQVVCQIKPDYYELKPGFVDSSIEWFCCDTCNTLTLFNIRNICPTYQCPGTLHPCDPEEIFRDNHYRRIYSEEKLFPLNAKEHTAQLTSQKAAELQTDFMKGSVNVLSCSTTFELGVDVGDLETVFMRNVPPSAANYIQRAGRAGRRTSATAFALTFAQRRSHDLSHYKEPFNLVSGEINPPHFEIANEKVVRRHIYATALAAFWKEYPDTFSNVEAFFIDQHNNKNGPALFKEFLVAKPQKLFLSIKRIVPPGLHEQLEIENWGWVSGLFDKNEGVLSIAEEKVTNDLMMLNKKRDELHKAFKNSDYILRVINTINHEYLISYLSKQNVIPKYGFPVDVVELQLLHHSEEAKFLELSRDLRIALAEYAPSSEVVAGGKLWTSRYIRRLPDRHWRQYRYAVCEYCQSYQRVPAESDEKLEFCSICHQPLSGRTRGKFIVPQFGFIGDSKPPRNPGISRPERTYTTRTYFRGVSRKTNELIVSLNDVEVSVIPATDGELAVINHAGYQGFKVCFSCGYAKLGNEKIKNPHQTPWNTTCPNNRLTRVHLGHEFKTDILQLRFNNYSNSDVGFWYSLLYAILEGTSQALDIDRQDLDGVLYHSSGDLSKPDLILFDDVPGGAGHVKRISERTESLPKILDISRQRLELCDCDEQTSCYGCLRSYKNQFCHDILRRGPIIKFLNHILT